MGTPRTVEEQLSPEQIAERLSVHPVTVYKWIKAGKFGTVRKLGRRIVRVPASVVNAFLKEREI